MGRAAHPAPGRRSRSPTVMSFECPSIIALNDRMNNPVGIDEASRSLGFASAARESRVADSAEPVQRAGRSSSPGMRMSSSRTEARLRTRRARAARYDRIGGPVRASLGKGASAPCRSMGRADFPRGSCGRYDVGWRAPRRCLRPGKEIRTMNATPRTGPRSRSGPVVGLVVLWVATPVPAKGPERAGARRPTADPRLLDAGRELFSRVWAPKDPQESRGRRPGARLQRPVVPGLPRPGRAGGRRAGLAEHRGRHGHRGGRVPGYGFSYSFAMDFGSGRFQYQLGRPDRRAAIATAPPLDPTAARDDPSRASANRGA